MIGSTKHKFISRSPKVKRFMLERRGVGRKRAPHSLSACRRNACHLFTGPSACRVIKSEVRAFLAKAAHRLFAGGVLKFDGDRLRIFGVAASPGSMGGPVLASGQEAALVFSETIRCEDDKLSAAPLGWGANTYFPLRCQSKALHWRRHGLKRAAATFSNQVFMMKVVPPSDVFDMRLAGQYTNERTAILELSVDYDTYNTVGLSKAWLMGHRKTARMLPPNTQKHVERL
ncbi:hypothetical protein KCP74_03340 [Salmonella enterica subsp. enterica]|nr:hypothetical protein KCP74_03340 [Salmonella enterica subsp. enterica]